MTRVSMREIPSIGVLLESPEALRLIEMTSHDYVAELLRGLTDGIRQDVAQGQISPDSVGAEIKLRMQQLGRKRLGLRRVINATGVVLHTNLGRAPLSRRALDAVVEISSSYSNLEYDLDRGARGRREVHASAPLQGLLGCEAVAVTNNNAAAVMLVLDTLARGGEVVVSRGELVEIGGGFRIPEVLEKAGCKLVEVGTTNRTRVSDYERAVNENTRLLLRVHPSNFKIIGFTERPSVQELRELADRTGLPLVEDLGSGCMTAVEGLTEAPAAKALADGVDIVTFSGDKLLGGPQAGIIAGRAKYVAAIARNPLMRALRVDKMVYAALEATLASYEESRAFDEVPALKMLTQSLESIATRAAALADRIRKSGVDVEILDGRSVPGAGSAPGEDLPTVLVALDHPSMGAVELEHHLRRNDPAIIVRVDQGRVVIDLRTVRVEEEAEILRALGAPSSGTSSSNSA